MISFSKKMTKKNSKDYVQVSQKNPSSPINPKRDLSPLLQNKDSLIRNKSNKNLKTNRNDSAQQELIKLFANPTPLLERAIID